MDGRYTTPGTDDFTAKVITALERLTRPPFRAYHKTALPDRVFLPPALERRIGTMVNYPLSRSRGAADPCPDPL